MAQAATQADTRRITVEQTRQAVKAVSNSSEIDRFISDKETAHLIGSSRSWPWKLAHDGKFPLPIKLSARCTRWRLSAVRRWMADPMGWQAANEAANHE